MKIRCLFLLAVLSKEIACFRKQTERVLSATLDIRPSCRRITTKAAAMEVDTAFLKSRRGTVKVAEMVTLFVAFVCFAVASTPKYIAATVLEFIITSLLLVLYLLKLNKRLTFFFWPLVDGFNSVFATVYFIVLSLMVLTTYTVTGLLVGGIVCFLSAGLLCVDSFMLFKSITFNRPRAETQSTDT